MCILFIYFYVIKWFLNGNLYILFWNLIFINNNFLATCELTLTTKNLYNKSCVIGKDCKY